jgi:hypothetical protein
MHRASVAEPYARIPLPRPPGAVIEILRAAENSDGLPFQIVKAIEADSVLERRLVSLMHTSLIAPPDASGGGAGTMTISLSLTKAVAVAHWLMRETSTRRYRHFRPSELWRESVGRAVAIGRGWRDRSPAGVDDAFAAGLLSQVGRFGLAIAYPEVYDDLLGDLDENDVEGIRTAERQAFGFDHSAVTANLFREWRMPEFMCLAVGAQDSPLPDVRVKEKAFRLRGLIEFGGAVAAVLSLRPVPRSRLTDLILRARRVGIGPDQVAPLFDAIREDWKAIGTALGLPMFRVPPLAEIYSRLAV